MVIVLVIVLVVVVGVLLLLVVPMVLCRVMLVLPFMVMMFGMMAVREALSRAEARDRRPNGTGQDI